MAKKTLLIVDDSPSIRQLVKNTVSAGNLFTNIFEAENGMEALKIFFQNKVDFVVTDVMMPKVDGYKFISAIKESEGGKDCPVIMLSASRKEIVDKIKGMDIGASDYLLKPFEPEMIQSWFYESDEDIPLSVYTEKIFIESSPKKSQPKIKRSSKRK